MPALCPGEGMLKSRFDGHISLNSGLKKPVKWLRRKKNFNKKNKGDEDIVGDHSFAWHESLFVMHRIEFNLKEALNFSWWYQSNFLPPTSAVSCQKMMACSFNKRLTARVKTTLIVSCRDSLQGFVPLRSHRPRITLLMKKFNYNWELVTKNLY